MSVKPQKDSKQFGQDADKVYSANGGEYRVVVGRSARYRFSRTALYTSVVVIGIALVAFIWLVSDQSAKARLDAAIDGNSCGPGRNSSCLVEYVTRDKYLLERRWQQDRRSLRPTYGNFTLNYEPNDARVDLKRITYRLTAEEWRDGKSTSGGTASKWVDGKWVPCEMDDRGRPKDCEQPIQAMRDVSTGQCNDDTPKVDPASATGQTLVDLQYHFLPLNEVKINEETGEVVEAFYYDYPIEVSREGFETRRLTISRAGWTDGLGASTLSLPTLALMPTPESMLDNLVSFRSELFCYMKKRDLSADDTPASVVDALREKHNFTTIALYERTQDLLSTDKHKAWWEERLAEIEAQKCDD